MTSRTSCLAIPLLASTIIILGCNSPMFPTPKHYNFVAEANHPNPGYQIVLLPFKNDTVELSGAIFEFNCLDKHPKDYQFVTKFFVSIHVNSPIRLKLPHSGNYRVTVRTPGFKRVNFDLPMKREDFVSIEVALEFDPYLAWELQPEFPRRNTQ